MNVTRGGAFFFLICTVKAHGRARQNGSGHNITKGTAGEGETSKAGWTEKIDGDRQTRDVGNDEGSGRMQGVEKMDAEARFGEG